MSAVPTHIDANPPLASGALSGAFPAGRQLLGVVQRIGRCGRAMARWVNRIAQQRLAGQALARLAPTGFNPTLTNALVVQAVAWTAALRERLLAVWARPRLVPEAPKAEREARGPGVASFPPADLMERDEHDWHDWQELARPWRMGPGGVAVAARAIAGLSDEQVVAQVCDNLRRAAAELGAEADVARIAAMEAAARALCPSVDAAAAFAADGGAARDSGTPVAGPARGVTDDPPPTPPPE